MTLTTTERKRLAALLRKKTAKPAVKKAASKRKTTRKKTSKVALPTAAEIKAAYGKNPAPKKRVAAVKDYVCQVEESKDGKHWTPVAHFQTIERAKKYAEHIGDIGHYARVVRK